MKIYTPSKSFSFLLTLAGLFGLAASASLTIEKMLLLEDPTYKLSCSLNEIFACGSIVTTDQASVFGFANSIIGVIAFPVLITLGLIGLAGFGLPRYFLTGMNVGSTIAHVFILWLAFQSLYEIGALCPWCMVVWAAVVPLNFFGFAESRTQSRNSRFYATLATVGWFVILITLIAARFYI
jgi:uncharacterized membrane protein